MYFNGKVPELKCTVKQDVVLTTLVGYVNTLLKKVFLIIVIEKEKGKWNISIHFKQVFNILTCEIINTNI